MHKYKGLEIFPEDNKNKKIEIIKTKMLYTFHTSKKIIITIINIIISDTLPISNLNNVISVFIFTIVSPEKSSPILTATIN